MCDTNQDILKAEFEALRVEIDTAKDRLFKLFLSGTTMPLVIIAVLVKFPEVSVPIVFGMPILMLSMFFRHEYERKVISRAGNYIKDVLEPKSQKGLSWETWLGENNHRHLPSRSLNWSFFFLLTIYYFAPILIYIIVEVKDLNYLVSKPHIGIIILIYSLFIFVIWLYTIMRAAWSIRKCN